MLASIGETLTRRGLPLTLTFSPWLYRYRNLVQRFFNKLKHFRAIATRFEKQDANYLALVKFAAVGIHHLGRSADHHHVAAYTSTQSSSVDYYLQRK